MREIVFKILPEMYKMQLELNDFLLPKWRINLKSYNFESAILAEAGEALESADYKWWKAGNYDRDNIIVELIDIIHFKLSQLYYMSDKDKQQEFEDFVYGYQVPIKESEIELLNNIGRKQRLFDIAKALSFYKISIEDVYRTYLIKYILNRFRKQNGYKDGTYQKDWLGKEDNEVAIELAKDIETENLRVELPKVLKKEYKKVLKGENNENDSTD